MKVYIVHRYGSGMECYTDGVFSTRDKAEAFAATVEPNDPHRSVFVEEYTVDEMCQPG